MKSENAIERRARVRSARLLDRPMTLRKTVIILKYIGDVDQPEQEHGGFHEQTIQAARSALHHIERLRRRSNAHDDGSAVADTVRRDVGAGLEGA